jgi:hypothetical protein
MKKFYPTCFFLPALILNVQAQAPLLSVQKAPVEMSTPIVVQPEVESPQAKQPNAVFSDSLYYFFMKHYYRNSTVANANTQFYTLKSPYQTTLAISHCGAVFLNSSPIQINGLRGLVLKHPGSPSLSVPFKLYLCNVNGSNLPVFPPLDSVLSSVSTQTAGVWRGGSFNAPVNVSGNFAVLFKCSSTISADTIRLFLNNASTFTSTVPSAQKFGEGLGVIRFGANFQSNTNTFGSGTDYEFVVAPHVTYTMSSVPICLTPTICNLTQGTFSNMSTPMPLIESRFFNLNKFKPFWAPTNTLMPVTDSIYNWTFTGSTTPPTTAKNPGAIFNILGIQNANLTVKIKSLISQNNFQDAAAATITVSNGSAPNIFVAGTTTFCSSGYISTTLTASGASSYTWQSPFTVTPNIIVTTSSTVVYTVMSENAGCTAVKFVTVAVNSLPNVLVTANNTMACTIASGGTTVNLAGTPNGGFYTGTNVAGAKFTPLTIGSFTAVYSYTNPTTGCTNSASVKIVVQNCGVSVIENLEDFHFSLMPNPAVQGKTILKTDPGPVSVRIYNVLGQTILEKMYDGGICEIDLDNVPEGTYVIKVRDTNGRSKSVKIVNQH